MSSRALRGRNVRIANSRWTTYALAGAATSLAGLATAEAEIHYSGPVNFKFKDTLFHAFPLEGGRSLSFLHFEFPSGGAYAHLRISSDARFAGDGAETSSRRFYFYRLGSHVNVSEQPLGASYKVVFSTSAGTNTYYYGGFIGFGHGVDGHFTEPGRGFIGFAFRDSAGGHYGWVRVKTSGAPDYDFIVVDYAWADPGELIETGQKRSRVNEKAVTKTGSLGLLATGATGLKAWREERAAEAPDLLRRNHD